MHGFGAVLGVVRYTVAAVFVAACLVALVYWAVRRGKLSAFGPPARFTRSVADPILRPLERRVTRWGGNPQDAPIWLIGLVLVIGLLFLSLLRWLFGFFHYVTTLSQDGPLAWVSFAIDVLYFVMAAALIARVIGSWIGMGRYNRWLSITYRLTDWLVEPIRRLLPPLGFVDFSPLVAWLVILLARGIIRGVFHV
jgi:YggT family protein